MLRRISRPAVSALLVLVGFTAQAQGESGEKRLFLTFLGDIMAHTVNYLSPDYRSIYRPVRWLLERDTLTFANLESPVDPSREYSSYPRFNVAPDYVQAAVEAGIEVFSLANNHAYDQGAEGISQTLRSLEALGRQAFRRIFYSGIRDHPQEPFRPVEITAKGVRIGFLAVSQMVNEPMISPLVHVVDYESPRQSEEFLSAVRRAAPQFDLFIVSYHGGREYSRKPESARARFFHRLLDAGVDIVYGHHPHVLQSYELVDRAEGRGLILYSAGNFISGMTWGIDPAEPDSPRAWTGDSVLWVASVLRTDSGAAVEDLWPVPVTNVKDRRGVLVVSTFVGLLAGGLPEAWARYYGSRQRQLASLLREWEKDSIDPR